MKPISILIPLSLFSNFFLHAMDIQIKREFTVTQIMLDLQKDQTEEEAEDLNISIQQQFSKKNVYTQH